MAEEDYEIDFYGDSGNEQPPPARRQRREDSARTDDSRDYHENERENGADAHHDDDSRHDHESDAQHQYRDYRSSERDDEGIDPGATTALMVSELNWWTTDDDIRGWLRQGDCEDGIKDMTFSEHKVNGKSKGQTYIEFYTQKEASGAKRLIDKMPGDGGHLGQKKITTQYWNPTMNPFRTLPKDAPARGKDAARPAPTGPYNDRGNYNERNSYNERGNYGGGFRGRGGFSGGRGNMGQNNFNRNYGNNNNNMGYNNMGGGGGGFGNQNGNAGGNFGFGARGGMMGGGMRGNPGGMRGGRGGMMGMNPMGGMPMGMPGNMGMGMMGNGMQGFQGMGNNFNGGFGGFQNQGDWGNPHGAKRPRPE